MRKIYNQIGLCEAAKKCVYGTDNIINGIKTKKISLIILSSKASFNTQKLIQDKSNTYNTPVIYLLEFENELSKAVGKDNIKVIGIKDKGFKRLMLKSIKGE